MWLRNEKWISKENRGDTTSCGYKFDQKCTAKEMLSSSPKSLLNNLPYEISGDRGGAQTWCSEAAQKLPSNSYFLYFICSFLVQLPSFITLHSFAKQCQILSKQCQKMSQEKSQPRWSLHSHMSSSLWKVLQNILSEILTQAKNLDTPISPGCTGTLAWEGAGSTSCPSFYPADKRMKISGQSLMPHVTRQSQSWYC